MGGIGSGNWYRWDKRDAVEDYRSLDVRRRQRDGYLEPGRRFSWQWTRDRETLASINVRTEADRVILNYRHRSGGEEWQSEQYSVRLDRTACTYGRTRAWFICPAVGCGRRVAILYLGGAIFACRHCYRLAYTSQREEAYDRQARRADTIRARLGWEPGILNGNEWKPKGMHWRTFDRLAAEHDAFVGESLAGVSRRLGINLFRKIGSC